MKRFCCYFFVLTVMLAESCFAQDQQEATVIYVKGSASVCKLGQKEPCDKIIEDMVLSAGDRITTASDASVELAFDEDKKNVVCINPSSDITVTLGKNEKINLVQGEVFSTIERLPDGSSFEIRTPTAVAGVRGTEWLTKVDQEGTDIEAFEGTPYAKTIDETGNIDVQETIVLSGHMTRIKRFQRPSALMPIPGKKQKQWRAMRAAVRQHRKAALLRKPLKPRPPKVILREREVKRKPPKRFLPQ